MDAPLTAPGRGAVVARAAELARDVGLSSVRAWKSAAPGRAAVGLLPIYVPREPLHAAGVLPVGVAGGGDMEIVRGDAYFQSYICRLPRSTIELGLSGALDALDGMIFPSTCDVIRNLSGMWQIIFPESFVRYFDMPQNFDEAVGGAFYERQLRQLLSELSELSGVPATDDRLRASIVAYNANRRSVEELYRVRGGEPWRLPTSELYTLLRAGDVLPVEEHTALLDEYRAAVEADPRPPRDTARVAIRGFFCEQPPIELVRTLERSGCSVVDDDWMLALRWTRGDVSEEGDPVKALVAAFLRRSTPACPSLHDESGTRGAELVASARAAKAEGVVFAAPSFCDPALLDQPVTMAAAKAAGLPCTSFQFSESTAQLQVIREQAGTFSDAIRLA